MLEEKCHEILVQAVSVIESVVTALLDGSITIGHLNVLMDRKGRLSELSELIQSNKHFSSAVVNKAIQARMKEKDAFFVQANEMSTLANLCQNLPNSNYGTILHIVFN